MYEHNSSANSSDGKHKGCYDGKARGVLQWENTRDAAEYRKGWENRKYNRTSKASAGKRGVVLVCRSMCAIVIRDENTCCPSKAKDASLQGKEKLQSSV